MCPDSRHIYSVDAFAALALQPLTIEEFGKNVSDQNPSTIERVRNPVFRTVFGALTKSLANDDVLRGAKVSWWLHLIS